MIPLAKAFLPAFLVTLAAALVGRYRGLTPGELAKGMPAVFLLLAVYFLLAIPEVLQPFSQWCRRAPSRAIVVVESFLLPYLLYSVPLGCFSLEGLARLALYINLPLLAMGLGLGRPGPGWTDGVALLLLWLPLDFRLVGPLWPWPPGQSGYYLFGPLGVSLSIVLFVAVRGMTDVGYTFSVRRLDFGLALLGFSLFAPVAIGFGLFTGFLRLAHHLPPILPAAARTLGIFLATGVPEELLFRGLIQNLILRWTSRPWLSIACASLIFGMAHLNNGARPDPRYFLLASLAGAVYGQVYRRSGTLVAPAMTHTLVDATWHIFFRG
jgi:membrane protease YdiL (CAAX protease family)